MGSYLNGGNYQAGVFDNVAVSVPELDKGLLAAATIDGLLAAIVGVLAARGRKIALEGIVRKAAASAALHLKHGIACQNKLLITSVS